MLVLIIKCLVVTTSLANVVHVIRNILLGDLILLHGFDIFIVNLYITFINTNFTIIPAFFFLSLLLSPSCVETFKQKKKIFQLEISGGAFGLALNSFIASILNKYSDSSFLKYHTL
jgi:uncharacterized membrane protein YgaE (UPF0421/DUF939 family)